MLKIFQSCTMYINVQKYILSILLISMNVHFVCYLKKNLKYSNSKSSLVMHFEFWAINRLNTNKKKIINQDVS